MPLVVPPALVTPTTDYLKNITIFYTLNYEI